MARAEQLDRPGVEAMVHQLSGLLARLVDLVESVAGPAEGRVLVKLHALRHDVLMLSKGGL